MTGIVKDSVMDLANRVIDRFDYEGGEKNLTNEERVVLARFRHMSGTIRNVLHSGDRYKIRTGKGKTALGPTGYCFDQEDIDNMKEKYFKETGQELTFWPQSLITPKGIATTVLTLGFNRLVNGGKERKYDAQAWQKLEQATAERIALLMKSIERFFPAAAQKKMGPSVPPGH